MKESVCCVCLLNVPSERTLFLYTSLASQQCVCYYCASVISRKHRQEVMKNDSEYGPFLQRAAE
jgi:hypothetical protein